MSDVRIGAAMDAIAQISRQYPDVEFYVRIKDGLFGFGIPNGPAGDAAAAAWATILPSVEVSMS